MNAAISCPQRFVVAFSCKRRGVCPSCNGRHMVQTAAHLGDQPKAVAAVTRIFLAEIEKLLCLDRLRCDEQATRPGASGVIELTPF